MVAPFTPVSFVVATSLLVMIIADENTNAKPDWKYGLNGPRDWPNSYPLCAGKQQSPINIITKDTIYNARFSSFEFSPAHFGSNPFVVTNKGYNVVGKPLTSDKRRLFVTGGNLSRSDTEPFGLVEFHIHWGPNPGKGSEHLIDGNADEAEAHFVYMGHSSGTRAVLAFRIEQIFTQQEDFEWKKVIVNGTALPIGANMTVSLTLSNMIPAADTSKQRFYRYSGSLTTPSCTEDIIWTVFVRRIRFSFLMFQAVRRNVYANNFRPAQPLNGRMVERNFY